MTFNKLKKIAEPHIRKGDNLPSNALLLLSQLHIPYKIEEQCREDFNSKISLLYNTPAFLYTDPEGNKTVYFKSNTRYWNFYVFHEIAHYLLGHEDDSPQNEIDADMLACILAAPIENLPSTIKSAKDISSLCQIPIDKAEMYWQEIKQSILKKKLLKSRLKIITAASVFVAVAITSGLIFLNKSTPTGNNTYSTVVPTVSETCTPSTEPPSTSSKVVITPHGTKYHLPTCYYVKDNPDATECDISEAIKDGYTPRKICMN